MTCNIYVLYTSVFTKVNSVNVLRAFRIKFGIAINLYWFQKKTEIENLILPGDEEFLRNLEICHV